MSLRPTLIENRASCARAGRSIVDEMNSTLSLQPYLYRIVSRQQESADVFTLELAPTGGQAIVPFGAGQFNMLYVFGVGEAPISISGDPARPHILIHTTRAVGKVTRAMSRLEPGDMLGVRGPFGTAWPLAEAEGRDVVFVAGGIGLAPLRPAIYHVVANRLRFGRITILYGTRSPGDILFHQDIEKWRSHLDIEVSITVDNADSRWRGNVGFVTQLVGRARFAPDDSVAMICGPEIMMHYTLREFGKQGLRDEDIYVTMERNMQCGVGLCGHCQFGPTFTCTDGPVFRYDRIKHLFTVREI